LDPTDFFCVTQKEKSQVWTTMSLRRANDDRKLIFG
jgi:hypothetical protein